MIPFIHRNPTAAEEQVLALMLSTYSDGSGTQRETDGTSRAGWREIERVFSEFLTGLKHSEDKDVFDLIVKDWNDSLKHYGVSIKSKQLTGKKTPFRAHPGARAYLEIANSPAKMWAGIRSISGLGEQDFVQQREPQRIGDALLQTIRNWKAQRAAKFEQDNAGSVVDRKRSYYLTLSFSPFAGEARTVLITSFPMEFPPVRWRYLSSRCLRADDPAEPGCPLLDWYPVSGGQLKFYPRFDTAHFTSSVLQMRKVSEVSILKKAEVYFTEEMNALMQKLTGEQRQLIGHLLDAE